VKAVALSFQGDIEQVPPMYSALKIQQKSCNLGGLS
jgi:tRNA U55 pseudouridine synthase TruB